MLESAKIHYAKNKVAISAKNACHQKLARFAAKNGYILRTAAAAYLDVTPQQVSNMKNSLQSVGDLHALIYGSSYLYTVESLEQWKQVNAVYFASIKKLSDIDRMELFENVSLFINFIRANATLSNDMSAIGRAKESLLLHKRYAA